jgi:hypothetical protein
MRIRMQQKTHEYRQNLHKRLREAEERPEEKGQEIEEVHILEEYAAMVEGALTIDGRESVWLRRTGDARGVSPDPNEPGEARKKGGAVNQTCKKRLARLKTIVSLHEEKKEALIAIRNMREWVLEAEHIFDGPWAKQPEEGSQCRSRETLRRLSGAFVWLSGS